jgi:hypothetical protein
MQRVNRMTRSFLLALLVPFAACTPATEKETKDYPDMRLDKSTLEFGDADWGETVTSVVYLANDGQMDMGIGSIYIGDDETQYTVSWDLSLEECTGASADAKDTASGGDTGDGSGDDSGDTGGTSSGSEQPFSGRAAGFR